MRRWPDYLPACVVLLLISGPLLFTDRSLGYDFPNHLWLAWSQQGSLVVSLRPTYFIHSDALGLYYPFFAFYGGTFYVICGLAGGLFQSITTGFVLVTFVGFASCYLGWYWIARLAGVGPIAAHAPATVVVTSAYYLCLVYARGAIPEFMSVSMLPLAIASGVHLVQSERFRALPFAAFVVAVVFFFGSHNISILWGTAVLTTFGCITLIAVRRAWLKNHLKRLTLVATVGLLALAVNAWVLVPTQMYSAQVAIESESGDTPPVLPLESLSDWVHPFRMTTGVPTADWLLVRAPVAAALWAIIVLLLHWRHRVSRLRTVVAISLTATASMLILIIAFDWPWAVLPDIFNFVQFRYRLGSYLTGCIAGLLIIALLFLKDASRRQRLIFGSACSVIVVFGLGLGVWQTWVSQPQPFSRAVATQDPVVMPISRADHGAYFVRANYGPKPIGAIYLDSHTVHGDALEFSKWDARSGPTTTNITALPDLIQVRGAEIVGRQQGRLTISGNKMQQSALRVEPAWPAPIAAAWIVSASALVTLLALFALLSVRDLRTKLDLRRVTRNTNAN